ncbi:LysR family transcriptional regulator [Exilibacterium tricleocarpae]|uniref:LysR family transcriptional regulator n=1 Tax=Exilibacterium tricleocarpae TaxID=2591008 RepID=A0A545T5V1_9GAMM|nr:LysR substrate-binding domain-containing protein [Exilibacterium tricleocarpae]TQV72617.1 LysR family transcriptional regulator [Exilibacterium tricleocarpae]
MNRYSAKALRVQQCSAQIAAVLASGSFSKAAELLGLHQSAVSHRVKALEAALGYRLFERTTRQLRPTRAGQLLGTAAAAALAEVTAILEQIEADREGAALRVSALASVTMKWLIPRLGPDSGCDLQISLYAQDQVVDLLGGEADVALRFSAEPPAGLYAQRLTHCWLRPVASPSYIETHRLNRQQPQLAGLHLLADRGDEVLTDQYGWQAWGAAHGFAPDSAASVTYFDRADLMLQAAIAGSGVALGRTLLVEDDIERGFLVYLGAELPVAFSYWIICTYETAETRSFQALARWLVQQAGSVAR